MIVEICAWVYEHSQSVECYHVPASAKDACGCPGDTRGGSAGFGFLGGGGRGFDG